MSISFSILSKIKVSNSEEDKEHLNIYVLDRGLQSTKTMKEFSKESITFIVRAKENRKYV
ncbi:hypothetical protein EZS27_010757, partial [termite gut metagenome]